MSNKKAIGWVILILGIVMLLSSSYFYSRKQDLNGLNETEKYIYGTSRTVRSNVAFGVSLILIAIGALAVAKDN